MNEQVNKTDVLIIGGGLVGQALALALSDSVVSITIVDQIKLSDMKEEGFDQRSLALSYNSLCILKGLNLLPQLKSYLELIETIHVSNQGALGRVVLDKNEQKKAALGAIISFSKLYDIFYQSLLKKENVSIISPAIVKDLDEKNNYATIELKNSKESIQKIKAKLVIACDGAKSKIREQLKLETEHVDYNAQACICNIKLKRSHQNRAFERFYQDGIIAMLPMAKNQAACVLTLPQENLESLKNLSDLELKNHLQKLFGFRLGNFLEISQRKFFPLHLLLAKKLFKNNVLLFGNAAHFLHPIAGQGFNLCLRDVAVFSDLVKNDGIQIENQDLLNLYEADRKVDHQRTSMITNKLVELFLHQNKLIKKARSFGLHMTERLPVGKSMIAHVMMGDAMNLPSLAKKRVEKWEL